MDEVVTDSRVFKPPLTSGNTYACPGFDSVPAEISQPLQFPDLPLRMDIKKENTEGECGVRSSSNRLQEEKRLMRGPETGSSQSQGAREVLQSFLTLGLLLIYWSFGYFGSPDVLSFNTSEDSPLPESANERSQWTTATDEAAQSPESLKNDVACDHKESTPDDVSHDNEDNQCRICYGDHSDADPLLSPCQCSGSLRYIHCSCLKTWVRTRLQSGSTWGAATRCEICTKTFCSVDNNQQEAERNFEELIFEVEHLMSELELLSTVLFMNKALWLSPMVYTTYFNRIGSPLRTVGWEVILNVHPRTPDT
ncbi:hypothetical protein CCH79_00003282 [Gambusia affinis]|uniref:RING-CH-type domain-containing protein n=1 Tax=Gambusia affinis TaxID=33528 RepID=A0A315VF45_GAMAF|nr:hypothetical protein CCH79_00003282 [Gambusia affinis]